MQPKRDIPDSERQLLWKTSMALVEADNLLYSHRTLQKFDWYIDVDFQWSALIFVLGELMARPTGAGKDDAWPQVEDVFKHRPNFISEHKKPLHIAIGNLCLKAWAAREKEQIENPQGSSWLETRPFIVQLREQRRGKKAKTANRLKQGQISSGSHDGGLDTAEQAQLTTPTIIPNAHNDWLFDSSSALEFSPDYSVPMMDDMMMDWQG